MFTSITTSARSLSTFLRSSPMRRTFSGVSRTVIELVDLLAVMTGWRPARDVLDEFLEVAAVLHGVKLLAPRRGRRFVLPHGAAPGRRRAVVARTEERGGEPRRSLRLRRVRLLVAVLAHLEVIGALHQR